MNLPYRPPRRVSAAELASLDSESLRMFEPVDLAGLTAALRWTREAFTTGQDTNFRFDSGNKVLTRTVTGNVIVTTGIGYSVGTTLILEWTQDATGGHTIQFPAGWPVLHGQWNTDANAVNRVVLRCLSAAEGAEVVGIWFYPSVAASAQASWSTIGSMQQGSSSAVVAWDTAPELALTESGSCNATFQAASSSFRENSVSLNQQAIGEGYVAASGVGAYLLHACGRDRRLIFGVSACDLEWFRVSVGRQPIAGKDSSGFYDGVDVTFEVQDTAANPLIYRCTLYTHIGTSNAGTGMTTSVVVDGEGNPLDIDFTAYNEVTAVLHRVYNVAGDSIRLTIYGDGAQLGTVTSTTHIPNTPPVSNGQFLNIRCNRTDAGNTSDNVRFPLGTFRMEEVSW